MSKLQKKIAKEENHVSTQATTDARNAFNSITLIPIDEHLLRFNPTAVNVLNLLETALSECRKYQSAFPELLGPKETIRYIDDSITSVLDMEIDRLNFIVNKNNNKRQ